MNNIEVKLNKKRTVLDIKTKKDIIGLAQQGHSHQKIATMYQVGRSTVTKILLKKDVIMNSIVGEYDRNRKRIRNTQFDGLEKKLLTWCAEFKNNKYAIKSNINSSKILKKAKEMALELGLSEFIGDNNWLSKFRRKYNLSFKISKKSNLESNILATTPIIKEDPISVDDIVPSHSQQDQNIDPSQLSNYIFSQNYTPNPTLYLMPYLPQSNSSSPISHNFHFNYSPLNLDPLITSNIEFNTTYSYAPVTLEPNFAFLPQYFDTNIYPTNLFY